MQRWMALEITCALLVGAVVGTGAHVLWGAEAASGAPVQVAGLSVSRPGGGRAEQSWSVDRSLVELHVSGCGGYRQGSGVLLRDDDGSVQLITNAHVVAGASTVRAVTADSEELVLRVLGTVRGRDVARLDPEPLLAVGLTPMDSGDGARSGDPVRVVGFPSGEFRSDVSSVVDVQLRAGYGSAVEVLIIGSQAEGGHSGSAVIGANGEVVGLVAARDPGSARVVAYRIEDVLAGDLVDPPLC